MAGAVSLFAQKEYSIAEIQGEGLRSAHDKEAVRVTGIVTAKVKSGFYIQTPDDKADKNPKTSDGILVYGANSVASVSVGDLVEVDGTVTEFQQRGDEILLTLTEISRPTVKVLSKGNPQPSPAALVPSDLSSNGKLDQMERFEGMRVKGDFVVVGPTGGYTDEKTGVARTNGTFYTVLQGTPRPFREPGVAVLSKFLDKLPATVPGWDMSPEILRINSQEQTGAKGLDLPAGAILKNATGVIDYFRGSYVMLLDAATPPTVENIKGFVAVSPAGEREVTVGSFNVENFFDDETNSSDVKDEAIVSKDVFIGRVNKASLAIRNVLGSPDVLGIVEMENLQVLKKLADKVNADAVSAGQPDPKYVPYLQEGNDMRGIDVGFLVRSSKVKVVEVKQLAKDEKLNYGGGSPDEKLFDRPPLMLRAEVADDKNKRTFAFTVIVNHFKSYRGIDDPKDGDRVRNKRRLEAEWLGKFIEDRVKADPNERLLVCGDFNAFQFNDGYNDLIGILKGKSDQTVLVPSKTAFATGLVDLIDYMDPKNRYSYTYDGSAQALDHMLISKPVRSIVTKFGYARVDADFPLVWANDATRPERLSDHDAPVVFLTLDTPAAAPAASPSPAPTPGT